MSEAALAWSSAPARDRRLGLVVFGAIIAAFGIAKIGFVAGFEVVRAVSTPAHMLREILVEGSDAALMIGLGFGSIFARRWARALIFGFGVFGLANTISRSITATERGRSIPAPIPPMPAARRPSIRTTDPTLDQPSTTHSSPIPRDGPPGLRASFFGTQYRYRFLA